MMTVLGDGRIEVDIVCPGVIKQMQEAVSVARSMRDSYGLKPSLKPTLYIKCRGDAVMAAMKDQVSHAQHLGAW